ncbi:MAG TPA: glycosyltransferase [Gemmatimonadaceae bacterium]|jgi:cellulose synthase/poly-beta-1,6-N-acetylglucosamine synthase-like glycosyltransferase
MSLLAVGIAVSPILIGFYAYAGYPFILWTASLVKRRRSSQAEGHDWPSVTITVPVYNAENTIGQTLDCLLAVDYPRQKLQVLVISDASTDGTDEIVRGLSSSGIELLRMPERRGKTAAENAAVSAARGDILVNVDSSIQIPPYSLKKLVRVFDDPTIGVASGRDVSVGGDRNETTHAESRYVGYEMWLRELETRIGSIVGASGCFYASRRSIHSKALAPGLSWDFAAALVARLQGFRSVSVPEAVCLVGRSVQIRIEVTRKVRTMARGISTLFHYRSLMNPFAYGSFAFMLISHKLLRWLPYFLAPFALIALSFLALEANEARVVLGLVTVGILIGTAGIRYGERTPPKPVAIAAFLVAIFSAGFLAWWEVLRQTPMATWEPTPRPRVQT